MEVEKGQKAENRDHLCIYIHLCAGFSPRRYLNAEANMGGKNEMPVWRITWIKVRLY